MNKDNIDLQFDVIDKQKDRTFALEKEIEGKFDEFIATRSNETLKDIMRLLLTEDVYKTGELKRMASIATIICEEITNYGQCSFINDAASYSDIYDKYVMISLLLRRIEMAADEEFSVVSYSYLPTVGIYAILEIIKSEYFERRDYILENLYCNATNSLSDNERFEWLNQIIERYSNDFWMVELAGMYLDYGQRENALVFLKKVENPSDDILDIITKLETMAREN